MKMKLIVLIRSAIIAVVFIMLFNGCASMLKMPTNNEVIQNLEPTFRWEYPDKDDLAFELQIAEDNHFQTNLILYLIIFQKWNKQILSNDWTDDETMIIAGFLGGYELIVIILLCLGFVLLSHIILIDIIINKFAGTACFCEDMFAIQNHIFNFINLNLTK